MDSLGAENKEELYGHFPISLVSSAVIELFNNRNFSALYVLFMHLVMKYFEGLQEMRKAF